MKLFSFKFGFHRDGNSGVSYDPLTTLLVSASGATNATYNTMIDAAILSLRSDNVLKYADVIKFYINETEAQDQYGLLRSGAGDEDFVANQFVHGGTPTKVSGSYLRGDASSFYIANYNPSSQAYFKFKQSDASWWFIGGGNSFIGTAHQFIGYNTGLANTTPIVSIGFIYHATSPYINSRLNIGNSSAGSVSSSGGTAPISEMSIFGTYTNPTPTTVLYDDGILASSGTARGGLVNGIIYQFASYNNNLSSMASPTNLKIAFEILGSAGITKTHIENVKTAMGL